MLAVDSPHQGGSRPSMPSESVRTLGSTVAGGRGHTVSRCRPAGRFTQYGAVPTGLPPVSPSSKPSCSGVRACRALATACLIVVAAGGVFGLASFAGGASSTVPSNTAVTQVRQGETLSELASRVAPEAQQAAVVQRIVALNQLSGVSVRAGQALVVPLGR